jgi:hypothetical protein
MDEACAVIWLHVAKLLKLAHQPVLAPLGVFNPWALEVIKEAAFDGLALRLTGLCGLKSFEVKRNA